MNELGEYRTPNNKFGSLFCLAEVSFISAESLMKETSTQNI